MWNFVRAWFGEIEPEPVATRLAPEGCVVPIHPVEPKTDPLPVERARAQLERRLGKSLEACWDHSAEVLSEVGGSPLITATWQAFAHHRPLIYTPDAVWITILQGLAHHIQLDPERHREALVAHEGRLTLRVKSRDVHGRSPENPWPEWIEQWVGQADEHLKDGFGRACREPFSTTTPLARTVTSIALMDAIQPFFDYELCAICGIPELTLRGTKADWVALRERVELLSPFDLDWWLPAVRGVLDRFVEAFDGVIEPARWRTIIQTHEAYGGDHLDGWILGLIPYLTNSIGERPSKRNPVAEAKPDARVWPNVLPSGFSRVPIRIVGQDGSRRAVQLIGGVLGVTVHGDDRKGALEPALGWAVADPEPIDEALALLREGSELRPPRPHEDVVERLSGALCGAVPGELLSAFAEHDGGSMKTPDGEPIGHWRSLDELEVTQIEDGKARTWRVGSPEAPSSFTSESRYFLIIADQTDGRRLARAFMMERGWFVLSDDMMDGDAPGPVPSDSDGFGTWILSRLGARIPERSQSELERHLQDQGGAMHGIDPADLA